MSVGGFRNQGLISRISRICCGKAEIGRCSLEPCSAENIETQEKVFDVMLGCTRYYSSSSVFLKSHGEVRLFSSQADTKTNGEDDDDLEDGFSDLETPQDTVQGDGNDDDLSSASEGEDTAVVEKKSYLSRTSGMTKAILNSPALPVSKVLDKWVEEGNEVTSTEVSVTMLHLRKRRLFVKALQVIFLILVLLYHFIFKTTDPTSRYMYLFHSFWRGQLCVRMGQEAISRSHSLLGHSNALSHP